MARQTKPTNALKSLASWVRDAISRDGLILPETEAGAWGAAHDRQRTSSSVAEAFGLEHLLLRTKHRFPKQLEQPDLLPEPAEWDIEAAMSRVIFGGDQRPEVTRRSLDDQVALLKWQFRGKPEILFWHALSISYLRRQTDHTDKARALFFRIWDEKADWMTNNLNGRWLISALQTFADHGRSHPEILCGAVGFMYGNLVKVYETEIASAYVRQEEVGKFRAGSLDGFFAFQPGDDILLNINTFALTAIEDAGPAALPLAKLLSLVRAGSTIFSRTDEIARRTGVGYLAFSGAMK